jgi:hypothetical protein
MPLHDRITGAERNKQGYRVRGVDRMTSLRAHSRATLPPGGDAPGFPFRLGHSSLLTVLPGSELEPHDAPVLVEKLPPVAYNDRQIVILERDAWADWLDPSVPVQSLI